jgi:serine kinase of HPr protein (carbohydrate metabolism regulator)
VSNATNLHATAVSINGDGVLLLGPSGCGKSDLALRLIDRGAVLVCDDRVVVENSNGAPVLRCAPNIEGKIEIRGLGIVDMPFVEQIPLRLCINLGQSPERMPGAAFQNIAGFEVPALALNAFEASAPLKVETAVKSNRDSP